MIYDSLAMKYGHGEPLSLDMVAGLRWLASALCQEQPPPIGTLRHLTTLVEQLAPAPPPEPEHRIEIEFLHGPSRCVKCGGTGQVADAPPPPPPAPVH